MDKLWLDWVETQIEFEFIENFDFSEATMKRLGLEGYNKPKKTPSHPTKSHVVMAKEGDKTKLIRFGQQGVKGSPKKEGESEKYANRRKSFKARHAKNIKKGKFSAAYWSNAVKWVEGEGGGTYDIS